MRKSLAVLSAFIITLSLISGCVFIPKAAELPEFDFVELEHIFKITESDIFERFGEPDAENTTGFYNMDASEFVYGKNRFCTEPVSGYLYYACIYDDSLASPRGVKTGMGIDELISLFRSEGNETMYKSKNGESYRLLYGEYESGGTYGVIIYSGQTPVLVEYSSEGCIFAAGIKNRKVSYIEFSAL